MTRNNLKKNTEIHGKYRNHGSYYFTASPSISSHFHLETRSFTSYVAMSGEFEGSYSGNYCINVEIDEDDMVHLFQKYLELNPQKAADILHRILETNEDYGSKG